MLKTTYSSQSIALPSTRNKVVAAIPCFNTQRSIGDIISRARKYVDEVIVVDDGSTDMTAEVAASTGAKVISHYENKGYGEAIRSCFSAAKTSEANILVTIDGDGQHNPDDIPQLLTPIFKGEAELVIGSRFLDSMRRIPGYRNFGIRIINWLWNLGSKVKVSDTQSGSRAYSKKIINNMTFSEKGMGISIEILEKCRRIKARIKEIPISCSYENNNSCFSLKAFRHGLGVAFSVLRIRLKRNFAR